MGRLRRILLFTNSVLPLNQCVLRYSALSQQPAGWTLASNGYEPHYHCQRIDNDGAASYLLVPADMNASETASWSTSRVKMRIFLPEDILLEMKKISACPRPPLLNRANNSHAHSARPPHTNCQPLLLFFLHLAGCHQPWYHQKPLLMPWTPSPTSSASFTTSTTPLPMSSYPVAMPSLIRLHGVAVAQKKSQLILAKAYGPLYSSKSKVAPVLSSGTTGPTRPSACTDRTGSYKQSAEPQSATTSSGRRFRSLTSPAKSAHGSTSWHSSSMPSRPRHESVPVLIQFPAVAYSATIMITGAHGATATTEPGSVP
jgi:hypothetical protein